MTNPSGDTCGFPFGPPSVLCEAWSNGSLAPMTRLRTSMVSSLTFLLLLVGPSTTARAKTDVWSRLGLIHETVTAMTIGNPGTIYVGTSSGALFRVESSGETLLADHFGTAASLTAITADPRRPSTLYAAT